MALSTDQRLSLGQKYLKKAFGDNIKFKRQHSGNPAERQLKANSFENEYAFLQSEIQEQKETIPKFSLKKDEVNLNAPKASSFFAEIFGSKEENLSEVTMGESGTRLNNKETVDDVKQKHSIKENSRFVVLPGAQERAKEAPVFITRNSGFKRPHEYDEEYDVGKLPKIRTQSRIAAAEKFKAPNQFQKEQDFRNLVSSHKKDKFKAKKQ